MGLTRPITRELTQILPRQLWRGLSLGKVEQILADARNALNIHPEQQVGGAYLVEKTPTLAGLVQDETPARKDRTRLSCRASDFNGTNQRFSGGNTSTGKTALSVFAWVRPTTLSSAKAILAEYLTSGDERGWDLRFNGTKLRVTISADGTAANLKIYDSVDDFLVSEWHHVGFVFNANTLTLYSDGKEISATKSIDDTVGSIYDSSSPIEIGSTLGGGGYFEGQIQQPLIYEGVWTPAQVRDLYLQQTDDIPITYGWFLDSDSANGLTSSSPALTPSNSPDLYEDDAVPVDWLNEKGWNQVGKFDGVDDYVDTGSNLSVDGATAYTIEAWVFRSATSGGQAIFSAPIGLSFAFGARINGTSLEGFCTTSTSGQVIVSQAGFSSNAWHHVALVFDGATVRLYLDGTEVDSDVCVGTLTPTTNFLIGTFNATLLRWDGQIFGVKAYSKALSADEITYNYTSGASGTDPTRTDLTGEWNLDDGTGLTVTDSSGNGNDGTISGATSDEFWANHLPKRWDEELDSSGNAADNSESFGVARRDGQLEDGACLEFTGTEYATNANLVGTETVTSSGGTSTPTISAGRIDFTAGTCWGLTLSNGSIYPLGEGAGTVAYDVVNDEPLALVNSPDWGNQSSYFWNENQGCSLYEHATSPDILVPFGSDGSALTITPPSGYTKTSDNPAGPWLYEGLGSTYVNFDVVPNANQWLEQRWQDTEGDGVGYLTLDDEITLSGAFEISFRAYSADFNQNGMVLGDSVSNSKIGFLTAAGGVVFVRVVNGGSGDSTIGLPAAGEHVFVLTRNSSDIVTLSIDGTNYTLFSGAAQTGDMVLDQVFADQTQIFTGRIRNLKIIDDGTTVLDFDSLIDLDLSSSLNNTTETATDITYNRLTDVSYQAGDTVEQPFSVSTTGNKVYDLVKFTFPVTTLSSTPTISQTVFEDGNTVTQDGILISES